MITNQGFRHQNILFKFRPKTSTPTRTKTKTKKNKRFVNSNSAAASIVSINSAAQSYHQLWFENDSAFLISSHHSVCLPDRKLSSVWVLSLWHKWSIHLFIWLWLSTDSEPLHASITHKHQRKGTNLFKKTMGHCGRGKQRVSGRKVEGHL